MTTHELLQGALDLAELGIRVHPLYGLRNGKCTCGRECPPKRAGKHPRLVRWQELASADSEQVREWWSRYPSSNLGIATGIASGVVVVDVDGPEGEASLAELERQHGALSITAESRSGRDDGGRHVVFAAPDYDVKTGAGARSGIAPGLDRLGTGGNLVAPPSLHLSGKRYAWTPGRELGAIELARAPEWLFPRPQEYVPPPRVPRPAAHGDERDYARYAFDALEGECALIAGTKESARNSTLAHRTFVIGTLVGAPWLNGALTEDVAYDALMAAARTCGLGQKEAHRTIRHNLRAGIAKPRLDPPPPRQQAVSAQPPAWEARETEPDDSYEQEQESEPMDDEQARKQNAAETPAPGVFAKDQMRTLGELDGRQWFTTAPPPRRWLLALPGEVEGRDPDTGEKTTGVLALGKVGMLAASGGSGKTMALVQLALAVATGEDWLDKYETPNPGHVLLALGEEDLEEVRRRLYNAAKLMKLTDEHYARACERIVPLALAGKPVALTRNDARGNVEQTPVLLELLEYLNTSGHDWRLIALDPLSRFAGNDAEKDNAAATRFIEAVETLTQVPGKPTVLLAHHTTKHSRSADGEALETNAARGASGLTDGARWVAVIDGLKSADGTTTQADLAVLVTPKSNYSKRIPRQVLVRDRYGALRAESKAEAEKRNALDEARKQTKAKSGSAPSAHSNGDGGPSDSELWPNPKARS